MYYAGTYNKQVYTYVRTCHGFLFVHWLADHLNGREADNEAVLLANLDSLSLLVLAQCRDVQALLIAVHQHTPNFNVSL